MKRIVAFLICLVYISCKKEENTVEVIFLKNLKESTKDYEKSIEQIFYSIEKKHFETKELYFGEQIKKLKFCEKEIDKCVELWSSIENDKIVKSYDDLTQKLNSIGLLIIFEKLGDNDKISLLPKEILIEYLKNRLYKPLVNNGINSLRIRVPYCGYFTYSKNGLKYEIEKVKKEKQDIEERLQDLEYELQNFNLKFSYK